jgi:hypothetical protein
LCSSLVIAASAQIWVGLDFIGLTDSACVLVGGFCKSLVDFYEKSEETLSIFAYIEETS